MWLLDKLMNKKKIPVPPVPIENSNVELNDKVELPDINPILPPLPKEPVKVESMPVFEDPLVDTFNVNPIKPEVHFEKQVENKVKDFFFIEKLEYADLLTEMLDLDLVLKDTIETTPDFVEIKKEEDQIADDFRSVMEDVEKKLIFVDKTLFGA